MNKQKMTPEEFRRRASRYAEDMKTYICIASAFAAFERLARRVDGDSGLDAAAGDVAIGFKRYANHLQAVHIIAEGGRASDAAEIDEKYGPAILKFLECQIREFAGAFTEFVDDDKGEGNS